MPNTKINMNHVRLEVSPVADTRMEKIAIAEGGVFGKGAGKSVIKNRISQSTSDFIYAIIVEEYGLVGGLFLLLLYIIFFDTYCSDCALV